MFHHSTVLSLTQRCYVTSRAKVGLDFANLVNMLLLAIKVDE